MVGKIITAFPVSGLIPGDPSAGHPSRLTARQQKELDRLLQSPTATAQTVLRIQQALENNENLDGVLNQISLEEARLIQARITAADQRLDSFIHPPNQAPGYKPAPRQRPGYTPKA